MVVQSRNRAVKLRTRVVEIIIIYKKSIYRQKNKNTEVNYDGVLTGTWESLALLLGSVAEKTV